MKFFWSRSPRFVIFVVLLLLFSPVFGGSNIHSFSSGSTNLSYIPVTITNSQSSATDAPFQDSFSFDPSLYTSYEASDLGNIRFFSAHSGTTFSGELYAWMQSFSGSSTPNLASTATVWIKLPNGIGASSSITIYLVFESTSLDFDGQYWGESPLIAPTFGDFDNGPNVFSVYNNGNSTFLSSQTGTGGSGPGSTTSAPSPYMHAISGSVNGGGSGASTWTSNGETTNSLPSSYVAQMYVYLSGSSPLTDLLTNVQSITSGEFYAFRFDARSGSADLIGYYPRSAAQVSILSQSSSGSSSSVWYQMTAIDSSDKLSLYKSTIFGLQNFGTLEAGPITGAGYTSGGIAVTTDGASSNDYWTMIIVRDYPPNGVMPSVSLGSVSLALNSYSFLYSYLNPSAAVQSQPVTFQSTSSVPPFVPITLTNMQSVSTQNGLQVELNVDFRTYESYLVSDAGNIRFFNTSSLSTTGELHAWLEYFTGNSTSSANTATNSSIWLSLKGTVINANSVITIYMAFENGVDYDGFYFGEAPQLSPVYGEYDNGASVFGYYNVAPPSTSGWTVKGSSGLTTNAPSGSHFASKDAFYANSASANYLYTSVPGLSTNEIITFWTFTTGLGNVFFLTNSAGKGQMARLDSRGGGDYSGLASTASWNSWSAPSSGLDESAATWYKYDIILNGSNAISYIGSTSNNLVTFGTRANIFSATSYGNYIGLVGDALGSSYTTYWNGFIIRYNPPNRVLPSSSFGSVVISGVVANVSPNQDAASVTLGGGLTFYENVSASSCSSPSSDTTYTSPSGTSSSFSISSGSSVCLWSPKYASATTLFSGSWLVDLWASAGTTSTLLVSIYTTNSSGSIISTIISNLPTANIGTSVNEIRTTLAGAQGNVISNGYIKLVLTSNSGGPSITIYWGSKTQPTNLESPSIFTDVLGISDASTSSMLLSMSISVSGGNTRLENFSVDIGSTPEISIGSAVPSPILSGPQVTISGSSELYITTFSTASSPGQSTVTISLKWQNYLGGPYAQSTLIFTID